MAVVDLRHHYPVELVFAFDAIPAAFGSSHFTSLTCTIFPLTWGGNSGANRIHLIRINVGVLDKGKLTKRAMPRSAIPYLGQVRGDRKDPSA